MCNSIGDNTNILLIYCFFYNQDLNKTVICGIKHLLTGCEGNIKFAVLEIPIIAQ